MKLISFLIILIISAFTSLAQITLNNDTILRNDAKGIDLNNLPFNAGEVRLIDFLDLLPGIHNYRNNSNNFSILGSPNEQNLIIIDNSPFMHTSNMIFNTDIMEELNINQIVNLFVYNNNASSITQLGIKNNVDKIKFTGQITPVSTQLTGAIPLSNRSNFIISSNYVFGQSIGNHSGRFSELYNLPHVSGSNIINNNYDFTAKYNYKLNSSNLFSLTYYGLNEKKGLDLMNTQQKRNLGSFKWLNNINSKVQISNGLSYSGMKSQIVSSQATESFILTSKLNNIHYFTDIDQHVNIKYRINYGVSFDYFVITPDGLEFVGNNAFSNIKQDHQKTSTLSLYTVNSYQFKKWFGLNVGLKYSLYNQFGAGKQYLFENTNVDTLFYSKGQIMQTYQDILPMLSLDFKPSLNSEIVLGYESNIQFINANQISNNSNESYIASVKTFPATNNIKPIKMNSIYLSLSQKVNGYQLKLIPFYRHTVQLKELNDGASLILNEHFENDLLSGSGNSYGITSFIQKSMGKLIGWIDYSYVLSIRHFDAINWGRNFNSFYNKNHDLSIVLSYNISSKLNISSILKYYSGYYVTLPVALYNYNGTITPNYSISNNYKTPDTFRFDMAINRTFTTNKVNHHFSLGVYNLLGDNTIDNINGQRNDFIWGIKPYLKYRFDI